MKKIAIYAILAGSVLLASCNKETDDRIFKQYLYARAAEGQEMNSLAVEGVAEGEYKNGAKAALQEVIDKSLSIYWGETTQAQVDAQYAEMNKAITVFEDRMNPFFSELQFLITQSQGVVTDTEVGEGEGKIPSQTDKDELSAEITKAETFLASTPDITQRMLTEVQTNLIMALYTFEGKIPGVSEVYVGNPSFEPATPTTDRFIMDFDNIPDWKWTEPRYITGFNPWDLDGGTRQANCLLKKGDWQIGNDSNVDGDYVMQLHEYSKPVWQVLKEGVHNGVRYTVTVNAGMYSWFPKENNFIRMQLVIFTGKPGDFNKMIVLQSKEFTNISTGALEELKMEYNTPASSEYLGKRMAITFHGHYKKEIISASEIDWDGSNDHKYFVDKVKITREKN